MFFKYCSHILFLVANHCLFPWQVLATMCEELPLDGVLLIYLSASGYMNSVYAQAHDCQNMFVIGVWCCYAFYIIQIASERVENSISSPSGSGTSTNAAEYINRNFQSHTSSSDTTSTAPLSSTCNSQNPTLRQNKGECMDYLGGCLQFGTRANGGMLFHSFIQV